MPAPCPSAQPQVVPQLAPPAPGATPTPEAPKAPGAEAATPTAPSPSLNEAVNQPAAAPQLASAATGPGSAPMMLGDIFTTQPTHIIKMSGTPTPFSTSSTAGEEKLADNTSPMPLDRLIFDYDYFSHVPIAPGGVGVDRYTIGFEKTFWCGNASIEVKLPFATTLDNNVELSSSEGFGATDTHAMELGNLQLWLKGVVCRGDNWAFTGGLGILVPTAPADTLTTAGSSGPNYEVENHSTHLLPFLGHVWTPTCRCWVQQILQFDVDTVGNEVLASNSSGSLNPAGTLHAAPFMFYDISFGYWLFHEPPCSGRFVTGLAGIFEMHYNQALASSNSVVIPDTAWTGSFSPDPSQQYVTSGLGSILGGDPAFSSVNLTAGLTAEIRDNAFLSVGYTVPVTGGLGREFNNQLQVYFNYYFGPSSKQYRVGPASAPATL